MAYRRSEDQVQRAITQHLIRDRDLTRTGVASLRYVHARECPSSHRRAQALPSLPALARARTDCEARRDAPLNGTFAAGHPWGCPRGLVLLRFVGRRFRALVEERLQGPAQVPLGQERERR